MSLTARLQTDYGDCLSRRCRDQGCSLRMNLIGHDHVLISGKKYQECRGFRQELCDFTLFESDSRNQLRLAAIELKGGNVDENEARKAHEQLQNGASVADALAGREAIYTFVPFLVKAKTLNWMASKTLKMRKYKVVFRSFSEFIKVAKCGDSLTFPEG